MRLQIEKRVNIPNPNHQAEQINKEGQAIDYIYQNA